MERVGEPHPRVKLGTGSPNEAGKETSTAPTKPFTICIPPVFLLQLLGLDSPERSCPGHGFSTWRAARAHRRSLRGHSTMELEPCQPRWEAQTGATSPLTPWPLLLHILVPESWQRDSCFTRLGLYLLQRFFSPFFRKNPSLKIAVVDPFGSSPVGYFEHFLRITKMMHFVECLVWCLRKNAGPTKNNTSRISMAVGDIFDFSLLLGANYTTERRKCRKNL